METTSRLHVIHVLQSVLIGSPFLVRPHPNCFHEGDAVYSNRKVHSNRRSVGAAGAALAMCAAIGLTACSSSEAETAKAESLEPAAEVQNLAGLCPENVVVQLQWQPQSDMGALFEMLGPGYSVDTDDKSVRGTLVAGGKDTGVDLTLRAGGPAIGFQSVSSQMYVDDSITLGLVQRRSGDRGGGKSARCGRHAIAQVQPGNPHVGQRVSSGMGECCRYRQVRRECRPFPRSNCFRSGSWRKAY